MPKFSYFLSIRRFVLACLLGGLGLAALGQTCAIPGWDGPATPSGVINSYHGGSGSPAAGVSSITVASIAGQRTNTRSLRVGDLILIMQMQDSSSGANAGMHEYAMITAISGATLTLNRTLTNSYNQLMDTSNVRNWQVVWVPQYSSATLSGTVSADRWTSNTGTGVGTGGIVAMDVAGSLALSGTVTVAGAGFRGAAGLNGTGNLATGTPTTANSTYVPGTPYGGQKGEGIQGTPPRVFDGTTTPVNYTTLLGQGYALGAGGRAAIGNAGGGANDGAPPTGGNQYNSGGGGGSNAGAGGRGGNTWNAGGTSGALNDPAGSNVGNPGGGLGGNAQTNSAIRLVLGGGGGAGSSNNNSDPNAVTTWPPTVNGTTRPPAGVGTANGAEGPISVSGASGGGVVLIRAGSISGAGRIVADGYTAFNTEGGSEGAGGGGAGGSVFVAAGSGGTGLTISAAGGGGGYSNYYNHGPGGGGGGGYIVTNFTPATTSVTAGTNGLDGCCGGVAGNGSPKAYNATAGTPGTVLTTGGTPNGVVGGAGCLPAITVSKSTTTPTITSATGATATYRINLANTGGAASNLFVFDASLPPGWAYTSSPASTYTYTPAPPGAASAGAENTSATIPAGLPVNNATTVNAATAVSLRGSRCRTRRGAHHRQQLGDLRQLLPAAERQHHHHLRRDHPRHGHRRHVPQPGRRDLSRPDASLGRRDANDQPADQRQCQPRHNRLQRQHHLRIGSHHQRRGHQLQRAGGRASRRKRQPVAQSARGQVHPDQHSHQRDYAELCDRRAEHRPPGGRPGLRDHAGDAASRPPRWHPIRCA